MTILTPRRPRQPLPTNLLHPTLISKSDYLALTEETYKFRPKKKKSRGRRGGKNKRKRPFYYRPQKDRDQLRFRVENPQLKIAKELFPEFEWINIADTPAEKFNIQLANSGKDEGGNSQIAVRAVSLHEILPILQNFLEWCKQLPENVILYGNPRLDCPLFQSHLQLSGTGGETALRVNLVFFSHKGEDYHFLQDGQGRAAVKNHLDRLNLDGAFEVGAMTECQICCESFPRADCFHNPPLNQGNRVSGCASCGTKVCADCQNQHLHAIIKPQHKARRNNAECITRHSIVLQVPKDGTCGFCRQGFWNANVPTHIPEGILNDFHDEVARRNGDPVPKRKRDASEYFKEFLHQQLEEHPN